MAIRFYKTVHTRQFIETHLEELAHKSTLSSSSSSCRLWDGEIDTHGYGVLRLNFGNTRIKLRTHRLNFFLSHHPTTLSSNRHVSHLCHNKKCISINHLSYEPQAINIKRNMCKLNGECSGHWHYKNRKLHLVNNHSSISSFVEKLCFC